MKQDKDLLDILAREEALRGKHHDLYILLGILAFLVLTALVRYLLDIYIDETINTPVEITIDKGEQAR